MNSENHLVHARRILAGIEKLDSASDTYAIIDATMIAGYHLGNAILHRTGATDDETHFNTPTKLEIPINELTHEARLAFDAFAELETLRSTFVRNAQRPGKQQADAARAALLTLVQRCDPSHP